MKESERIRKEMNEDESDNDFRILGYMTKILRAERKERFEDMWLTKLKSKYTVLGNDTKYTIETDTYGVVDYYPKANNLLIRRQNRWIKPGLKWIINNLLK